MAGKTTPEKVSPELDTARKETAKWHPKLEVRQDGTLLTYFVTKVPVTQPPVAGQPAQPALPEKIDLIERDLTTPERYTVLMDFPKHHYKRGQVKMLAEPYGEQCAGTASELAVSIGCLKPEDEKKAAAEEKAEEKK